MIEEKNALINELLSSLKKTSSGDKLYLDFINYFFANYTPSEEEGVNFELLHKISFNLFQLLQNKIEGKLVLNVVNIDEKKSSSFIEIVNEDMPFLVDSITNYIANENIKIKCIINSVLPIQRKDKKLAEISDKAEHKLKSVMSIEIERIDDAKKLSDLKKSLTQVLNFVTASVHDWQKMQGNILKMKAKLGITQNAEQDYIDFCDWIYDNNFILLGYAEYDVKYKDGLINFKQKDADKLGILKVDNLDDLSSFNEKCIVSFSGKSCSIDITKSTNKSPVHRDVHLDVLRFSFYNSAGQISEEFRFLGLFTSQVFYQKAFNIPIIRDKFNYVLKQCGFNKNSHNGKELISILESYPREELFMISAKRLHQIVLGVVSVYGRNIVKVYNRIDRYKRFLSILCFIPKRNFGTGTRQKIQEILAETYKGEIAGHQTQISDMTLARVHFIIKTDVNKYGKVDYDKIESKILKVTTIWQDSFNDQLKNNYSRSKYEKLSLKYNNAFSGSYQTEFSSDDAINDINIIENIALTNSPKFCFSLEANDNLRLKIYGEKAIALSKIMPLLENFGLNVVHEHTFIIKPNSGNNRNVWVHDFKLQNKLPKDANLAEIKEIVEPAISDCWQEKIENDQLNILITTALLPARDISLIRSFAKFVRQTEFSYSYNFLVSTLVKNHKISSLLRDYFYAKFSPKEVSLAKATEILKSFHKQLTKVTNIAEDSVFENFLEVINAIVRTNFFQTNAEGQHKEYISFKALGKDLTHIPLPKPHAEIFVYSPTMEGVHLRGGKVARGGLRWSDRIEDFRTEIQGLVKAQMTKNSVIVPVGSKGGFIVKKNLQGLSREDFMQEGINAYKTFLRGLLDITDNVVNDEVIHPKDVVICDEKDPYLVVAADKGTATFSDIANSISAEYNFWLGDAFASGGSNGYDHKKMGITAKGAWVSVTRHFYELGINIEKQEFTAVGIGDMAGDVFGNGMLLSNKLKLVAAFNHMHIFIDPNPNAQTSYAERKRLFNLPRSTWKDYDLEKISTGGGIYERSAKSIKLSKVAQQALSLDKAEYSPDDLIRKILQAPVDLLWNGGIGTYAKSKSESHLDVGDRANDAVRVDAYTLGSKVIGEGGNLGLTQRARIEYALKGGFINTDAIDNSAGVDCSDHEVNIKIALQHACSRNFINQKQRDEILENMTQEVEDLVLYDNYLQTQAISLAQSHGVKSLGQQERLMCYLERIGYLNRKVEFLPDSEEVSKRLAEGTGLTRPELSVLLAYSKNYLYNNLVDSNLPEEKYFERDLIKYFPKQLTEKFQKDIFSHKLRREIIATFVTNSMVNRVGMTFFFRLLEDTGMKFCDIARAYAIVKDAFGFVETWKEIEGLQNKISHHLQLEMYNEINLLIERSTAWLLRNLKQPIGNIEKTVASYKPALESIFSNLEDFLSPNTKRNYNQKLKHYKENNVPSKLAARIASMNAMSSSCQIVEISFESKIDIVDIARTYFEAGTKLQLNYLRTKASLVSAETYWHKLSIKSFIDGLFDQQMRITKEILTMDSKDKKYCPYESMEVWLHKNRKHVARYNELISDIQNYEQPDFAMLNVASHRIKEVSLNNSA